MRKLNKKIWPCYAVCNESTGSDQKVIEWLYTSVGKMYSKWYPMGNTIFFKSEADCIMFNLRWASSDSSND